MRNFKKVLSMALALVMVLATMMIVPLTTSADDPAPVVLKGQGTAANPYLVGTAAELAAVKAATWDGSAEIFPYDAIYVKLTADIAVEAGFRLSSDGGMYGTANTKTLAWHIDGDGYAITGLTVPLFGSTSVASEPHTFRDLTLSGTVSTGERRNGLLIGCCYGNVEIENCVTEGTVSGSHDKERSNGGLIGYLVYGNAKIIDCVNNAAVTATGGSEKNVAGGLVGAVGHYDYAGEYEQSILFCTNNGAVNADKAGGIVGAFSYNTNKANNVVSGEIYNCLNTGAITGTVKGAIAAYAKDENAAPATGSFSEYTILECYTTVADLAIFDADASDVAVIVEGIESITNVAVEANKAERPLRNYTAAEAADAANKASMDIIKARMDQTVYEIATYKDLEDLCDFVQNEAIIGTALHVKLVADIDMREGGATGKLEFTNNIYGGKEVGLMRWVFDGDGHMLYNKVTPLFAGLGQVKGGQIIRDLHIVADAGELKDADRYFSAFVGAAYGDLLIEGCTLSGMVKCTRNDAKQIFSGAFVGFVNTCGIEVTLNNCANYAVIRNPVATDGSTKTIVGGLIGSVGLSDSDKGDNVVTVKNCINAGDLWNKYTTGGLIGQVYADFVTDKGTNAGSITVNVENCINTGAKYSSEDDPSTPDKDETAVLSPGEMTSLIGTLTTDIDGNAVAITIENCYSTVADMALTGTIAEDYLTMTGCFDATAAADEANAAAIAAIAAQAVHNHVYVSDCDAACDSCELARADAAPHTYDTVCDVDCNACGEIREVPHVYDNACDGECNTAGCGATRTPAEHVYENPCDVDCNECAATRTVPGHEYDNACDAYCNNCDAERETEHTYTNACDAECDVCQATRTPAQHVYDNDCDTKCNVCEAEREIEHTYDNACDAKCNVCEAERTPADHVYDNDQDASCNVCGAERTVAPTTTKAPETTAAPAEEEKGCGSALNSTYAILALVAVLGFAFVAKKREEN